MPNEETRRLSEEELACAEIELPTKEGARATLKDEARRARRSEAHLLRERDALRAQVKALAAEGPDPEAGTQLQTAERERDEARRQRDALALALKVLGPPLRNGQPHWLLGAMEGAREFLRAAGEYSGDLSDMAILAEVVRAALAKAGRK